MVLGKILESKGSQFDTDFNNHQVLIDLLKNMEQALCLPNMPAGIERDPLLLLT